MVWGAPQSECSDCSCYGDQDNRIPAAHVQPRQGAHVAQVFGPKSRVQLVVFFSCETVQKVCDPCQLQPGYTGKAKQIDGLPK
jgi:hypothetical protein